MHDPVMNFAEQDKCKRPGDAEARVENGQNAGLPPYEDVLARIWAFGCACPTTKAKRLDW
nr:hypothetical protein [Paraburkholderia sp. BL8N3]